MKITLLNDYHCVNSIVSTMTRDVFYEINHKQKERKENQKKC